MSHSKRRTRNVSKPRRSVKKASLCKSAKSYRKSAKLNRKSAKLNRKIAKSRKQRSKSVLRGGVLDNIEQCMTQHDPIDLTEWDDDIIQEWDIVRIPHENLPGRFWCFKKDSLSTWRAINPDKNPMTNVNWTPEQVAVINANVPILIVDEEPAQQEADVEDLAFVAEQQNKPIDQFKIQLPKNTSVNEIANPTASIKVRKDGRIINYSALPTWFKNRLTQAPFKQHVMVRDEMRMKIFSTDEDGNEDSRDQRGYVPNTVLADIPNFEGFGDYLVLGLAPGPGPKRIINWAADQFANFDIWTDLRDGLDM